MADKDIKIIQKQADDSYAEVDVTPVAGQVLGFDGSKDPQSMAGGGTSQVDGTYGIEATAEGATSGNARGENSVDLCTKRSNAAYVPSGICSANIAGEDIGGSGTHSLITGDSNHSNEGNNCSIAGHSNYSNSGYGCIIAGQNNYSNEGNNCSISGSYNRNNEGDYCSISGSYNYGNEGDHCLISGSYNYSNSGKYCSILGGGWYAGHHTNSGDYCSFSGTQNHSNEGDGCLITGYANHTNLGDYCLIAGQYASSNSGDYCLITGRYASSNALDYARVHGGNSNARIIDLVAQINATGGDNDELLLGGSGGTRIIIPDQSAWMFDVHFVAKTATGANAKMAHRTGVIVRDGTSTSIGTVNTIGTDQEVGTTNATFGCAADDTNEALQVWCNVGSGTCRAVARIQLTQVDY